MCREAWDLLFDESGSRVRAGGQEAVRDGNSTSLEGFADVRVGQGFELQLTQLTVESGEITFTLKVKSKAAEKNYAD